MKLQLNKIKNFIRSVKKNEIAKIFVKSTETSVLVNKTKKSIKYLNVKLHDTVDNMPSNDFHNYSTLTDNKLNHSLASNSVQKTEKDSEQSISYSTIVSPMVGTFYRSPAPNEQPFIEKNDIVKPKQIVCIIEAMKLMNEIEAEVNGEIVEILVSDGDIVDCGQALMKVKN